MRATVNRHRARACAQLRPGYSTAKAARQELKFALNFLASKTDSVISLSGLGYNSVVGAAQQTQLQVPFYAGIGTPLTPSPAPQFATPASQAQSQQAAAPAFYFTPMPASSAQVGVSLGTATPTVANGGLVTAPAAPGLGTLVPASALTAQPIKFQSVADVSQVS